MDKNSIVVFCTIFVQKPFLLDRFNDAQYGYRSASTLSYKPSSLNEYLKLSTIIHKIIPYKTFMVAQVLQLLHAKICSFLVGTTVQCRPSPP